MLGDYALELFKSIMASPATGYIVSAIIAAIVRRRERKSLIRRFDNGVLKNHIRKI